MKAHTVERTLAKIMLAGFIALVVIIASAIVAEAKEPVRYGETGPAVVELQEDLRSIGYSVVADGKFGPLTLRAVRHFQRANGWRPVYQAGPLTLAALESVTVTKPASRGTQTQTRTPPPPPTPAPTATGPCAEWVPLLQAHSPGWDISHFQRIMFRESRCDPSARNPSGASGLMQIMPFWANGGHLRHCGISSRTDLFDPAKNVCGAAHIYRTQGINAWSQTK